MQFSNILALIAKPAYKSTEFWTAVLTALLFLGNSVFNFNLDSTAILAIAGTNSTFIAQRGWQKHAAAKAVTPAPVPAIINVPPPVA